MATVKVHLTDAEIREALQDYAERSSGLKVTFVIVNVVSQERVPGGNGITITTLSAECTAETTPK